MLSFSLLIQLFRLFVFMFKRLKVMLKVKENSLPQPFNKKSLVTTKIQYS